MYAIELDLLSQLFILICLDFALDGERPKRAVILSMVSLRLNTRREITASHIH